jgi:hypothetical protein
MVIHRMHSKIHELRQRPKDEREAIASLLAVVVVVVLLVGWVIFFVRGVVNYTPHLPQGTDAIRSNTVVVPSGSNEGSTTPISKVIVGAGASSTMPMSDDSADATVKALMQIANGQQ